MDVIKLLLKIIGYGILSVVLLIAAIITYENYKDVKREEFSEKIVIEYFTLEAKNYCDKLYPYVYVITNNSEKTIDSVSFYVELRKAGYSKVINKTSRFEEDKILKPGEKASACFYVETSDYPYKKIEERDVTFKTTSKYIEVSEN